MRPPALGMVFSEHCCLETIQCELTSRCCAFSDGFWQQEKVWVGAPSLLELFLEWKNDLRAVPFKPEALYQSPNRYPTFIECEGCQVPGQRLNTEPPKHHGLWGHDFGPGS